MAEKKFTVLDLLELELPGHDALNLKCIAGRRGLPRALTVQEINRPGLALSGFYELFQADRLQIFGRGETAYLQKLHKEKTSDSLVKFFKVKFHVAFLHIILNLPKNSALLQKKIVVLFCRRIFLQMNFQTE